MTQKINDYTECPACSGKLLPHFKEIKTCESCGGKIGTVTAMSEIDSIVTPFWSIAKDETAIQYFDFMIREEGKPVRRFHGWYSLVDHGLVQIG